MKKIINLRHNLLYLLHMENKDDKKNENTTSELIKMVTEMRKEMVEIKASLTKPIEEKKDLKENVEDEKKNDNKELEELKKSFEEMKKELSGWKELASAPIKREKKETPKFVNSELQRELNRKDKK